MRHRSIDVTPGRSESNRSRKCRVSFAPLGPDLPGGLFFARWATHWTSLEESAALSGQTGDPVIFEIVRVEGDAKSFLEELKNYGIDITLKDLLKPK